MQMEITASKNQLPFPLFKRIYSERHWTYSYSIMYINLSSSLNWPWTALHRRNIAVGEEQILYFLSPEHPPSYSAGPNIGDKPNSFIWLFKISFTHYCKNVCARVWEHVVSQACRESSMSWVKHVVSQTRRESNMWVKHVVSQTCRESNMLWVKCVMCKKAMNWA